MNKDIIYIDTEDDITSIIGRIKDSKDQIIALVPPKRIGVLQSAVNLRLLARAAKNSSKHLVIITNNRSLAILSSMAQIPTARNLQSKPEMAEISALEIDDDVIDGAKLPVGDLDRTVTREQPTIDKKPLVKTFDSTKNNSVDDIISGIDVENDDEEIIMQTGSTPEQSKTFDKKMSKKEKKALKIPDFSRFRKRFFFSIVAGLFVISALVWAFVFAPAAIVTITAKTSVAPISTSVNLISGATDVTKRNVQVITKTLTQSLTVDFDATGSKLVGDKATGTLTLTNSKKTYAIEVLAGTVFSKGGYKFVTTSTVDVPSVTIGSDVTDITPGTVTVSIVAAAVGADYNLAAGSYVSSVDNVTASGSATSGGASHQATVVTSDDIDKALKTLKEVSTTTYEKQLNAQYTNGEYVIDDSFLVSYGTAVSTPLVDAELTSGKAKLVVPTTMTIQAISKSDMLAVLKDGLASQLQSSDKVYDDGSSSVKMSGYTKSDSATTVNISATGKIGPNIDTTKVKSQVAGRRYGDVQSTLSSIDGVSDVDTKFSYFWVTSVPTDLNKITVEFKIENE